MPNTWWAPLPSLIGPARLMDSCVNQDLTAVTVEVHLEIHLEIPNLKCTLLRIIDRFTVDADGRITAQENFFDPSAVTNPA